MSERTHPNILQANVGMRAKSWPSRHLFVKSCTLDQKGPRGRSGSTGIRQSRRSISGREMSKS
eukprot:408233-Pyramimonas_sp.AAC.3